MPKKKPLMPWDSGLPLNAEQGLPIVNIPLGLVEVSDKYLWIRFSENGQRTPFRIADKARMLYEWTVNPTKEPLEIGKLSFRLEKNDGAKMVVIEPSDHTEGFQFEVWVVLSRLNDALFYFFN